METVPNINYPLWLFLVTRGLTYDRLPKENPSPEAPSQTRQRRSLTKTCWRERTDIACQIKSCGVWCRESSLRCCGGVPTRTASLWIQKRYKPSSWMFTFGGQSYHLLSGRLTVGECWVGILYLLLSPQSRRSPLAFSSYWPAGVLSSNTSSMPFFITIIHPIRQGVPERLLPHLAKTSACLSAPGVPKGCSSSLEGYENHSLYDAGTTRWLEWHGSRGRNKERKWDFRT